LIHPDTSLRFISEEIGFGVVATKRIPKGTITWVQDPFDRIIAAKDLGKLCSLYLPTLDTYCFRNRDGDHVFCWDNARFVNHSFNPSCFTTAYNFEIAVRDIEIGEELTDDYGYLNIETPFTPKAEKGSSRKVVYPNDIITYQIEWDALLLECLKHTPNVKQPLRPLVEDALWTKIGLIAEEVEEMDSIINCYHESNVSEIANRKRA
jgi:hypothetical protein